jgi:hypothetical protein
MLETIIFKSFKHETLVSVFRAMCGVNKDSDQKISLCSIEPPVELQGKSFIKLYESLAREGVIPIGILRNELDRNAGNLFPFVITNPLPSLIILGTDVIYVFAAMNSE